MTAGVGALVCPKCGHVMASAKPQLLSKRQAEILAFVQRSFDEHNVAPTFDEIAKHFSLRSLATVHEHLETLAAKGWIRREYNLNRGIELLHRLPAPTSSAGEASS